MAMVSVTVDSKAAIRAIKDIDQRQIPFVTAVTLTRLAQGSQLRIRSEMDRFFTLRSKNRMLKGVRIKPAKKKDFKRGTIQSEVNDIDDFMPLHTTGGTKRARRSRYVAVPTDYLLAKGARTGTGKIKKGRKPKTIIDKIKAKRSSPRKRKWGRHGRKRPFIQESNRLPFIAQRVGPERYPLNFLWGFERSTRIKEKWPFAETVAAYCMTNATLVFNKEYKRALQATK